uniref:Putative product n=1 Tax=Xenopsylla cheopis TaxID=163159 RepID=A0A6M2E1M5_XENCH
MSSISCLCLLPIPFTTSRNSLDSSCQPSAASTSRIHIETYHFCSFFLSSRFNFLISIVRFFMNGAFALTILALIFFVQYPSPIMMLPKYSKCSTSSNRSTVIDTFSG